jgi:drug/metabolite transporter (DMT)-like permease
MSTRQLLPLIGALFALYIIWGSTYFAIAVGVASWPPLMMAGVRFLSAGAVLTAWLLATGHKLLRESPAQRGADWRVTTGRGEWFCHSRRAPARTFRYCGGHGRDGAAVHPVL